MRYDTFMRRVPATVAFFCIAGWALGADTLDLYFIDVEGGQATLLVAASGESLLIDTGYNGYGGRDAVRIRSAAKAAGIKRIDHLLITHFHDDHVGGVENLVQQIPVATFLDHGVSVESNSYTEAYSAAFAKAKHRVVIPGDKIPIKGLDVTVVASAGKDINRQGDANPHCAGVERRDGESGENPQSVGIVVEFGKFRFADLGDLTWNRELDLLCPANKVGRVDLFLMTHHGGESPAAIRALAPRVAVMNNGPRKGGDANGWKNVMESPGLESLWQLHFAMAAGDKGNAPDAFIANLREDDAGIHLKVSALADGSFTVVNPRNNFSKTYAAR
jgi:competence protein ComEC